MSFEIVGKIIEIQPVNQVSDKFRKREFVIERKETGSTALFVDYIKFQLVQDKCDLIDNSYLNTEVKVLFNIKGNKWERDGKTSYFTNLDAWKIERTAQTDNLTGNTGESMGDDLPPYINDNDEMDNVDMDDLPF